MIYYSIVLIPLTCLFIGLNLILMPFSYLKTCYNKFRLLINETISFFDCLGYILFGMMIQLFSQFTDAWAFLKWQFETKKPYQSDKVTVVSDWVFDTFYGILQDHA